MYSLAQSLQGLPLAHCDIPVLETGNLRHSEVRQQPGSSGAGLRPGLPAAHSLTHRPAAQTRANANKNLVFFFSKFKNFSSEYNLVSLYCRVINQEVTTQMSR